MNIRMEQQFRVSNKANARTDTRIRVFFFCVVMLLLSVLPVPLIVPKAFGNKFGTALAGVAVAALVAGIVGAFVITNRMAVQRMKQACVWKLTDNELIRNREGWPDVRIGLSEKASLYSRPGWLVVHSTESGQEIAIPEDVERFPALRRELTKHYPVVAGSPKQGSFWIPLTTAVAIGCCIVVLSKTETVVKVAAVSALLLLQGWQSIRTGLAVRRSSKRVLVWSFLGMSWVFTLAVFGYLVWRRG